MNKRKSGSANNLLIEVARPVHSITELIGCTPLIELSHVTMGVGPRVLVKHEGFNPGGSIRDRTVLEILNNAAASGLLHRGDELVLAGATNSAVSATVLGSARGYKTTIFHPESGSPRFVPLLRKAGATLNLTSAQGGLEGAVGQAASHAREKPGRIFIDAGRRQALQDAVRHIGREVVEALDGRAVGAFVTSYSTGATLRWATDELTIQYPELFVVGVTIKTSADSAGFYNDVAPSVAHDLEPLADLDAMKVEVSELEAWRVRALLAKTEGLLLGPKGASAALTALRVRDRIAPDKAVVALSIDGGHRYFGSAPEYVRGTLREVASMDRDESLAEIASLTEA